MQPPSRTSTAGQTCLTKRSCNNSYDDDDDDDDVGV